MLIKQEIIDNLNALITEAISNHKNMDHDQCILTLYRIQEYLESMDDVNRILALLRKMKDDEGS